MFLSNETLKLHYHPQKGWLNDPNGLCRFQGYYHLFYQYIPNVEYPGVAPAVWGHARTKDFLHYEELPVALDADQPYDVNGVWSGTAVEKDGRLYLFYASIDPEKKQKISIAFTDDGEHFEKYEGNPVLDGAPPDGSYNFRDPAVLLGEKEHSLVIASSNVEKRTGNLLLYKSTDLLHWSYSGVLAEFPECKTCECPSFVPCKDGVLLAASAVRMDGSHFFTVMFGSYDGKTFTPVITSDFQKGPDVYAGQIFHDTEGRNILISWIPGWKYIPKEKCIGCLSLPLELKVSEGKILACPVEEVWHLISEDGTVTDDYIEERYENGGEAVYIRLLTLPEQ